MTDLIAPLEVAPGSEVRLSRDHDPGYTSGVARPQADALLADGVELLADYRDRLTAQDAFGVLLVLQGIDAAGKDSTIKHVMSGVNPQAVEARAFKQPSAEELNHDFLWRYQRALPGWPRWRAICRSLRNRAGWSVRNSVTLAPVSHRRRTARRSSSTSPPHTPCAPIPNACRIDSSRQSGRTGQQAQTAMACAAWSRALATPRASGNQSSGSTREPAHPASWYTRPASSPSVRLCGSRRTWLSLETISTRLHLLPSGQLVPPSSSGRQRLRIPSPVSGEPPTLGMRARGRRRQSAIMSVTLCIRPGDGVTIMAISGEVDVCTEAQLQQSLLRIIRECGAKLMLDVSGVSFMDCAGLRALLATRRRAEIRGGFLRLIATSAAVRRIIELTGAQEALAMERSTTDGSVEFL